MRGGVKKVTPPRTPGVARVAFAHVGAFRGTNSGRQVYESKGCCGAVRIRGVGRTWSMRLLGIALAVSMSLAFGGDFRARAAGEPWSRVLDPARAIAWSH